MIMGISQVETKKLSYIEYAQYFDISAGYEHKLNQKFSVQVEPQYRTPLLIINDIYKIYKSLGLNVRFNFLL